MKTLLKLSVIASFIILIAMGCKKIMSDVSTSNGSTTKEFNASFVKEWYYGTFIKSDEFRSYNQKENGIKVPDWKNGKSFNIGQIQIVEFPLQVSKKSIGVPNTESKGNAIRIVEAAVKKIVFIKNKDNSITIKEMLYIPEFNYLKSKNYDISNLSIKDYSESFKGTVRSFDWSEKFENGYIYTNKGNYKLKQGIPVNSNLNNSTANRECGGVLETWFEFECSTDYAGDDYNPNQCHVTDIITQTYTPFYCGPEIDECNEANCMCAMYGIGCDNATTSNPEENNCGNISNEEGRQQLNSIIGENLFEVSYIEGSQTAPDGNGVIRLPKIPRWPFYSLDFGLGYKPNWVAEFSGIVYKNHPTDLWKWQSIQYVNTVRNGSIPPCSSANMQATVANPSISSDKMIATTAASWSVTVSIPCLLGVEVDVKTGSIPSCELRAN